MADQLPDPRRVAVNLAVHGLYVTPGQARIGVNDPKGAFDSYLTAAREAMRLSDDEQALHGLQDASDLACKPGSNRQQQPDRLRRQSEQA